MSDSQTIATCGPQSVEWFEAVLLGEEPPAPSPVPAPEAAPAPQPASDAAPHSTAVEGPLPEAPQCRLWPPPGVELFAPQPAPAPQQTPVPTGSEPPPVLAVMRVPIAAPEGSVSEITLRVRSTSPVRTLTALGEDRTYLLNFDGENLYRIRALVTPEGQLLVGASPIALGQPSASLSGSSATLPPNMMVEFENGNLTWLYERYGLQYVGDFVMWRQGDSVSFVPASSEAVPSISATAGFSNGEVGAVKPGQFLPVHDGTGPLTLDVNGEKYTIVYDSNTEGYKIWRGTYDPARLPDIAGQLGAPTRFGQLDITESGFRFSPYQVEEGRVSLIPHEARSSIIPEPAAPSERSRPPEAREPSRVSVPQEEGYGREGVVAERCGFLPGDIVAEEVIAPPAERATPVERAAPRAATGTEAPMAQVGHSTVFNMFFGALASVAGDIYGSLIGRDANEAENLGILASVTKGVNALMGQAGGAMGELASAFLGYMPSFVLSTSTTARLGVDPESTEGQVINTVTGSTLAAVSQALPAGAPVSPPVNPQVTPVNSSVPAVRANPAGYAAEVQTAAQTSLRTLATTFRNNFITWAFFDRGAALGTAGDSYWGQTLGLCTEDDSDCTLSGWGAERLHDVVDPAAAWVDEHVVEPIDDNVVEPVSDAIGNGADFAGDTLQEWYVYDTELLGIREYTDAIGEQLEEWYEYDKQVIESGLDCAGQGLSWAGEQVNAGLSWAGNKVGQGLEAANDAGVSVLDGAAELITGGEYEYDENWFYDLF